MYLRNKQKKRMLYNLAKEMPVQKHELKRIMRKYAKEYAFFLFSAVLFV